MQLTLNAVTQRSASQGGIVDTRIGGCEHTKHHTIVRIGNNDRDSIDIRSGKTSIVDMYVTALGTDRRYYRLAGYRVELRPCGWAFFFC
ncbi:hypothetical protein NY054_10820 [Corynebacterium diphtheriae bv. mitis]|nr:hypothetical protein NY054_10820 [Corynebacterium diphtheriae bv. mitis]